MSSSTRPRSDGSRSAYERTRQDVLPGAGDVGLVAVRPAELLADAVLPLEVPRHRRPGLLCRAVRASRRPRRRCRGGRRSARACRRGTSSPTARSGSPSSPGTRWSTRTPTLRSGPGLKSRRCSDRSSMPSRYSTTTPSIRRSSPQTFSTSSASWRPSTKIRLGPGDAGLGAATAIDPDAVRVGATGPCASAPRGSPARRRAGSPDRAGRYGACCDGPQG